MIIEQAEYRMTDPLLPLKNAGLSDEAYVIRTPSASGGGNQRNVKLCHLRGTASVCGLGSRSLRQPNIILLLALSFPSLFAVTAM